jgi:hypothetical protein
MVHDSLSISELDHYIQVHGGGSKKTSAKTQMDGSIQKVLEDSPSGARRVEERNAWPSAPIIE